jgi:hypothetical protein
MDRPPCLIFWKNRPALASVEAGSDIWRVFGRQRQPFSIVLADNLHRAERLNFTFVLHTPTAQLGGAMRTSDSDSKYCFNVTVSDMGTFVLEIFLGGVQVAA